jgi:hypothetical protein
MAGNQMANFVDWNEEQSAGWHEWLASRPPVIQELAAKLPGDRLYRIKDTGHRGTIHSYHENSTVTLLVDGRFNRVLFSRKVFGLSPEELEECDLPSADEQLGDFSAESETNRAFVENVFIPTMREKIRKMNGQHPHLGGFRLLPAAEGTCPECATAHDPAMPHNQRSITYQYDFYGKHGRWPTWKDAMAHCSEEMKQKWTEQLTLRGISVE